MTGVSLCSSCNVVFVLRRGFSVVCGAGVGIC